MRIGFVGAGTVGTTLALGLTAAGYTVGAVASRSRESATALAARLPHGQVCADAQAVADTSDLVFLTVPDDAIGSVAACVRWRPESAVVHCSGATDLDVLAPARAAGAAIASFHPMQMFADVEVALASLPGTTITLVGDAALVAQLDAMARALSARPLPMPPGNRALYHASAPFVGPFTIALLREASRLWQIFGVREEDALAALLPLLRGTLASIERVGLAGGMGGPVSRGDSGTIARHLAALAETAPDVLPLYCALSLRTIPLAIERGSLTEAQAAVMRDLLASDTAIAPACASPSTGGSILPA